MRLSIFGATGKTGSEIVKLAMANGHEVTALVRDPAKMLPEDQQINLITGDVLDFSSVKKAVEGQDAVICALGSSSLGKTLVRSDGTANIINAMNETNVKRLFVISAMGVGESWSTLSFINKLFFATLLWSARQDHEKQETFVKDSNLDWTIIRPSGLTDSSLTGSYDVGENILAKTSQIARADIADLIIKELGNRAFIQKAVTITN